MSLDARMRMLGVAKGDDRWEVNPDIREGARVVVVKLEDHGDDAFALGMTGTVASVVTMRPPISPKEDPTPRKRFIAHVRLDAEVKPNADNVNPDGTAQFYVDQLRRLP